MATGAKERGGGASVNGRGIEIDKFFRICMKHGGSDLHLKVNLPVMIRYKGEIRQMDMPPLTQQEMERLCLPMLDERERRIFEEDGGVDFAHVVGDDEARFRVNLFKQRGHWGMVARLVNATVLPFEKLFLPPILGEVAMYPQGLIILAGITGSGKSTTIASMIQYINDRRRCHILTIEDPIEYLFKDVKSVINQREVGIDVRSWEVALKHAVREDPDVILVGELRDRDTFSAALHAAETGHLVFGTIHASTAPSTLGRILDLFPADMHPAIRQSLVFNLRCVVAQKLVKTTEDWQKKGINRVPINEIMIVNPSIRKAIAEEQDSRLADIIRVCENEGMQDFTKALVDRVEAEMITRESAFEIAPNPDALKMALKGIKLPVSGLA
jgi:twitching motility protein PilT